MIAVLIAASFTAAPQAPVDAAMVAYAPKISAIRGLMPFFEAAGQHALFLRPAAWREEVHPLLHFDVADERSLSVSGIDRNGPLTVSWADGRTVSCLGLLDAKAYAAHCDDQLSRWGEVFRRSEAGTTVVGAKDAVDRISAGYVLLGKQSCAVAAKGLTVKDELGALPKLLQGPVASREAFRLASTVKGAVKFILSEGAQQGALGLSATNEFTLTSDGRARGLALLPLAGPGTSPFANFSPDGMAVLRLRLARSAMGAAIGQWLKQMPSADAFGPAARLLELLEPHVTGNVALLIHRVEVKRGLRTRQARFFAVKMALLAQVSDAKAAGEWVETVDQDRLTTRDGTLRLGLHGSTVVLSNDEEAEAAAVSALLPTEAKQQHAGEVRIDPKRVARGLSQVPLLEVLQSPELAAVLALATQLGPLLSASQRVAGWVDESGKGEHRAELVWQLDAAKGAPSR